MAPLDPNTERERVDAITDRAENERESFTPNSRWREAALEVFGETYRHGGAGALNTDRCQRIENFDLSRHHSAPLTCRNRP